MRKALISSLLLTLLCTTVQAKTTVTVEALANNETNATGSIGTVILVDTRQGLLITPNLSHLSPGLHGFHIHENPSCADNGNAAGGHLDPRATKAHKGPYDHMGHVGDLPALVVDANGNATLPTLAPRLTERALRNHAVMIHAGGDNYSDEPQKLGGGGARIACGVVK